MSGPAAVIRHIRRRLGPAATDTELLRAYAVGQDPEAFRALVERHGRLVLAVCRRRFGDIHAAEDAFQATFLALARNAGTVRRPEALAGWLIRSAERVCGRARATAARRRTAESHVSLQLPADPAADLTAREMLAALDAELDQLPERYRLPVWLAYWQGLSHTDAARRLGLSAGAFHGRLERGRRRLADRLRRRGFEPGDLRSLLLAAGGAAIVPSDLLARTAGLAVAPWSATIPAAVLTLATPPSKLVPAVMFSALLAGAGVMALAAGGGSPSDKPTATPAVKADEPDLAIGRGQAVDPTHAVVDCLVVDEAGKPMTGARVRLLMPYLASGPTTTDAAGRCRLSFYCSFGRVEGLVAESADGEKLGYQYLNPPEPTMQLTARVKCRPARTLRIRAVDGQGLPVAGARAAVTVDAIMPLVDGVTDADGATVLRLPADAQRLQALAFRSGVGFDYADDILPTKAGLPTELTLRFDRARAARIKVTDTAGRPIPGVILAPNQIRKLGRATDIWLNRFIPGVANSTGQDGVAVCDWLPHDLRGMVLFHALSDDYFPGSVTYDPNHDVSELTIQMPRPVRISGRVTRGDGRPAAGVLVRVCGCGPMEFAGQGHRLVPIRYSDSHQGDTRTGADGAYHLALLPGQSFIVAPDDKHEAAPSHHGPILDEAKEGVVQTGIDFRLGEGTIVRGRVMGGNPPRPAAGQEVRLVEEGAILPGPRAPVIRPLLQRGAKTDAEGRFQFRVGPGSYQLWPPGEERQPEQFRIANEREMPFELTAVLPVALSGIVRDDKGRAMPDARVIVLPGWGQEADARTDKQGRFRLERRREPAMLLTTEAQSKLASLTAVSETDETVEIIVRPAARVSGRLVGPGGKPMAGADLSLYVNYKLPPATFSNTLKHFATDADGRFAVDGLPGDASFNLSLKSQENRRMNPFRRFETKDGQKIDLGDMIVPPTEK
jgi:RNA polymerase sigma factor (sigma-70 family)